MYFPSEFSVKRKEKRAKDYAFIGKLCLQKKHFFLLINYFVIKCVHQDDTLLRQVTWGLPYTARVYIKINNLNKRKTCNMSR